MADKDDPVRPGEKQMLQNSKDFDQVWLRRRVRRILISGGGLLIWILGLFVAYVWGQTHERLLSFPLGPLQEIWRQTHGPGPIPILILGGATAFYIVTLVRGVNSFKEIVEVGVSDGYSKTVTLGITNMYFILMGIVPIGYVALEVYEIYSNWLLK